MNGYKLKNLLKGDIKSKLILIIRMLDLAVKEKQEASLRLDIIAKRIHKKAKYLSLVVKKLSIVEKEKEEARVKLVVVAKELRKKAKQLAIIAKEKEKAKVKLAVVIKELRKKAKQLAIIAKEKEKAKVKLAVVIKELSETSKQLEITAKQLEKVARQKEIVRRKLAEVTKQFEIKVINQNKFQDELKDSEIRYRRLFEAAHDGILILNAKTAQISDVNPFLEKLLGYSKKEFLNKKLWEVGAFKNMKASKEAFEILQDEGILRYDDLPLETKDGDLIEVEFVSNSYMVNGALVIQCNIRDITERKKMELIKETERYLKEERLKVASIADATHELRTPIAIIKGNIDLARETKGKYLKSPKSALRSIDHEVEHISNILSDLTLITSRGAELKNRIVLSEVSLKPIIKEVVARSRIIAFKKNISINATKIQDIYTIGDKEYLEKMITNLVKNSIMYGNKNGHTIIYTKKSKGFVHINVEDDGIGIKKEDLHHVFERFYRADKSHQSDESSIGLGLSIVKWVAEAHGGHVTVKNKKKEGSIFTVSLPLKPLNIQDN